ncbi:MULTISPECIES: aromatic ring-hydroxylating oxygenase subunit alpha [Kordiimonas]|jgi:phenylpropionate dioxygenase-like ring-hydroxylating dioxygenase large terminal subunit|uniref:aromatic ring-hydroxylating oxygenase subunit alpha n=1 Tax=Kordiimonas TaxID=288021 RepID=UPI00257D03A0|nr:aromatic ring-hydroxylating dioxygenase subunit alpha [Kordiimonas sp. UBA4487]
MTAAYESLPSWAYYDEAYFAREMEAVVRPAWQLVCHQNDVPNAGDYVTLDILNERLVAVRGKDGKARVFHNVCRHRGSRLLEGNDGSCPGRIRCPYHAWTWDLEGTLVNVPYERDFEGFDRADHFLPEAESCEFLGFIWARLVPGGPSIEDQFAPYVDELSRYRIEEMQPLGRLTLRPRAVNWKQIADNYADALHIPVAHSGLSGLVGNTYGMEVKGDIHKMWGDVMETRKDSWSTRHYKSLLPKVDHLPEHLQRHWCYYRLWPNVAFDVYPDQIDFMQFIPVSATETLIREVAYVLPDERREMQAARYLNWRINREVNAEDTVIINRVQDGMASSSFSTGPLAKTEVCLLDSVRRIREALPEDFGAKI